MRACGWSSNSRSSVLRSSALWPSLLLCLLLGHTSLLPGAVAAGARAAQSQEAAARWLSAQLRRPVEASQLLLAPDAAQLEGCTITRVRPAPTGATALSLRCPGHLLPQLVLLKIPFDSAMNSNAPALRAAAPWGAARKVPPLVRAGSTLAADWKTSALHAELPVIALDSGAAGAEIRVRVTQSSRILRARILTAHSVAILAAGA